MKTHRWISVACAILAIPCGAQGQVRQWVNPGVGSWFKAANWNNGVPAAGETAFINNGGTAEIIGASTPALLQVYLGTNFTAADGRLHIDDGHLTTTLTVFVGNHGFGDLRMEGNSTIDTPNFTVGGNGSLGDGTLRLFDGVITTGNFSVGHVATGFVLHSGGTINASQLIHGNQPDGDGSYQIDGGSLNVSGLIYLGIIGDGHFTQNGGSTVSAGTGVYIASQSGSGDYQLNAGTLIAGYIHRGPALTGIFNMNGGRLEVGEFGSLSAVFPLTVDGGELVPGGNLPGITTIRGDYVQNGAGSLAIQLDGTASGSQYDVLRVFGGVTLAGPLDLSLGFQPTVGDSFTIVDNDAADPVTGSFAGLPESATVSASFNNTNYDFVITYLGGDGNDVVLTALEATCVAPPPGMAAWWPLDETSGTTAADLINGNDGTHVNGPTPLSGEFVENSLCFDGISQYVEVPDAPELDFGTGDFSIDAWVRTTVTSGVRLVLDKRANPVDPPGVIGYSMYLFNGQLGLQIADGDGSNICGCSDGAACTNYNSGAPGFVADGEWHHVAVTVNRASNSGGTFYVDGSPVGNFDPTCRPESISNASVLRIARQTPFAGSYFDGCIDEVELFDRELDAAEVASIFGAGELGKCKCDPCDTNCDGSVDLTDVEPFIELLLGGKPCGDCAGDTNGDGSVDLTDVEGFIECLLG